MRGGSRTTGILLTPYSPVGRFSLSDDTRIARLHGRNVVKNHTGPPLQREICIGCTLPEPRVSVRGLYAETNDRHPLSDVSEQVRIRLQFVNYKLQRPRFDVTLNKKICHSLFIRSVVGIEVAQHVI